MRAVVAALHQALALAAPHLTPPVLPRRRESRVRSGGACGSGLPLSRENGEPDGPWCSNIVCPVGLYFSGRRADRPPTASTPHTVAPREGRASSLVIEDAPETLRPFQTRALSIGEIQCFVAVLEDIPPTE